MTIIEEHALYKSLNVEEKTPDGTKPWKTMYEVI